MCHLVCVCGDYIHGSCIKFYGVWYPFLEVDFFEIY